MAVNASFIADFSQFNRAVEQAEAQLREFGLEPQRVEKSLARLTGAFEGRKLIGDAIEAANAIESIGGVSKLSEVELQKVGTQAQAAVEKLRLLGKDVPQNLQALAEAVKKPSAAMEFLGSTAARLGGLLAATFSAGAIISAVSRTVEWAGRIEDLSAKLGLSTESVQRFDFAARQNGSSVEAVSRAMVLLSKNVDSNSDGFARLGLRVTELKGLNQEDLFRRVGVAIAALPSKTEQLAAAQQLLGRSGADLLPLFQNLEKDMARAVVASDESIKAGDELGDAWDALKTTGAVLLSTVITPFAPGLASAAAAASNFARELKYVQEAQAELLKSGQGGQAKLIGGELFEDVTANRIAEASKVVELQLRDMTEAAVKAGDSLWNMSKPLPVVVSGADDVAAAEKRLNNEIKATSESIGVQSRLMGGDMIASARAMVAAYGEIIAQGFTPTKAAAFEMGEAIAKAQKAMLESGQGVDASLETTRRAVLGLNKDTGDLVAKFLSFPTTMVAPMVAVDEEMQTLVTRAHERIAAEETLVQAVEEGIALADEAAQASTASSVAMTSGYQQVAGAARDAASAIASIAIAIPDGTSIYDSYADYFKKGGAMGGKVSTPSNTFKPNVVSFANGSGGYRDFGSGTPAMLHGIEKVVPAGKGDGVSIVINVQGSALAGPSETQAQADKIGAVLSARLRSMGIGA